MRPAVSPGILVLRPRHYSFRHFGNVIPIHLGIVASHDLEFVTTLQDELRDVLREVASWRVNRFCSNVWTQVQVTFETGNSIRMELVDIDAMKISY